MIGNLDEVQSKRGENIIIDTESSIYNSLTHFNEAACKSLSAL